MNDNSFFIEKKVPEPLTQKELIEYYKKFKNGDLSAREIIIKRNIKLVLNQVWNFNNYPLDKKELVSIGLIGLIKSVDTYDLTKNSYFSTYATKCIVNEILLFIRTEKKHFNDESINKVLEFDENTDITLEDMLTDETVNLTHNYEEKELYFALRKLVNQLPERDKEIIFLHFGFNNQKPLTQKELASKYNITQSYVSRIITNILKRLAIQLKEINLIEESKLTKSINTQTLTKKKTTKK